MKKIILSIEGMSCSACSVGLEKYLNKQEGIISASVNLVLAQALIEAQDNITVSDLNKMVESAGFKSLGVYDGTKAKKKDNKKNTLIIFGVLAIFVIYISMASMFNLPQLPYLNMEINSINYALVLLIFSCLYLIYGFDIIKNGYKNFIHKTPNMDTLVSIGVLTSFLYSLYGTVMIINNNSEYIHSLYFESVCIIIYFIKFGRYIDSRSKEKTKESIHDLVTITPSSALIKTKDGEKEITIDEIKKKDILICKAGMKVASDGIIINGSAHFDESFITGESIPVRKSKGNVVNAGSLNIDGYIEYEATKIGRDSTISEIVRLVVEATNTKAPIAALADSVSGIFVPCIIVIAFITFFLYLIFTKDINTSLNHFVTVLVVACPCALGLATPLAVVISEGVCAKRGILVKKSSVLECASKINVVAFDKTGTLTYGKLNIGKIYNYSTYTNDDLIKIVSSLEAKSTHPIKSAFADYKDLYEVDNYKNIEGIGLSGFINNKKYYLGSSKLFSLFNIQNNHESDEEVLKDKMMSVVYIIEEDNLIGLIGVSDTIRSNIKDVIKKLKHMNIRPVMITGDNIKTAKLVANNIGINEVYANVMPSDKTNKIKELMKDNVVCMIGDGINDAPSLATANIGVSLASGTDIASNSADVLLMHNDIMDLVRLIKISKKTIKNIKQNLFWAFFYNACMIPISIGLFSKLGINMNPMIAALAMTFSSISVTINALRLKRMNEWRD